LFVVGIFCYAVVGVSMQLLLFVVAVGCYAVVGVAIVCYCLLLLLFVVVCC